MQLKNNSINVLGIRPELILALVIADKIYDSYGKEMVITSVTDGTHSRTSLHYSGAAVDLRTSYFTLNEAREVVIKIKKSLNIDYDVILESNHIHIEYQPRQK